MSIAMRRPGSTEIGLLNDFGIGQSEFMWYLRGNPNVKKVFSQIWKSDELCVSFDGAGCYRDWHINPTWKTQGAWYHCDQVRMRDGGAHRRRMLFSRIRFESRSDARCRASWR